jgi:hypothetical protein
MGETEVLPSAFMTTKTVTSISNILNKYNQVVGTGPNPAENFGNDLNTSPALNGWGDNASYSGTVNPTPFDYRTTLPGGSSSTYTKTTTTTQVQTSLFNDQTTFFQAFQYIFSKFANAVNLPNKIVFDVDDSVNIQLKTGGLVGVAAGNKGTAKAINNAIGHLLKPNKKETYLSYALRLAKHLACNIKASPTLNPDGSLTIIISPPVYDREYNV